MAPWICHLLYQHRPNSLIITTGRSPLPPQHAKEKCSSKCGQWCPCVISTMTWKDFFSKKVHKSSIKVLYSPKAFMNFSSVALTDLSFQQKRAKGNVNITWGSSSAVNSSALWTGGVRQQSWETTSDESASVQTDAAQSFQHETHTQHPTISVAVLLLL